MLDLYAIIPQADFRKVLAMVEQHFVVGENSLHGFGHWMRVIENGLILSESTGANPKVTTAFGLLHDSCRLDDGRDTFHGPRAVKWVQQIGVGDLLGLTEGEVDLLIRACAGHTNSMWSQDPTIATCWDADRLDIPRVGTEDDPMLIDPYYLSTDAAKDPSTIAWATGRATVGQVPDFAMEYL